MTSTTLLVVKQVTNTHLMFLYFKAGIVLRIAADDAGS
jgi:hypothetical protein